MFSWFVKSNWSSDFGNAETGSKATKRMAVRHDLFHSNFKVERENVVWTKLLFLAIDILFTCGDLTLNFLFLKNFLIWFFSGNAFPNSFIVRSRSSFCLVIEHSLNCLRPYPAMLFCRKAFWYMWCHNHLKSVFSSFIHAISTEVRAWRHFSLLVERGLFCSFAWLSLLSRVTYPALTNDFLTLALSFLYFNSKK